MQDRVVFIKIPNAFASAAFNIAAADVSFLRNIFARKKPVPKAFRVAFLSGAEGREAKG